MKKYSTQLTAIFNDWKVRMADMLVVTRAKANAVGYRVLTWLMLAVINGEEDIVKELSSFPGISDKKMGRITPIQIAIQHNRINIVKILLDNGVDVNTKINQVSDLDPISLLLTHKKTDEMSVLDIAISFNRPEIATLLLEKGAKVSNKTMSLIAFSEVNDTKNTSKYDVLMSKMLISHRVRPEFAYTSLAMHLSTYADQLGYHVNPEVICQGLACMAMQAILANDLDVFNQRISLILKFPPEFFSQIIDIVDQKILKKIPLSGEDALLVDARMFFEGLVAYQQGNAFLKSVGISADINQNPMDIAAITWPTKLDKKKQSLVRVGQFSGVYMNEKVDHESQYEADEQQIVRYLKLLHHIIAAISPLPLRSPPIVFHLSTTAHIICISYNISKARWAFINAAEYPDPDMPGAVKFCSDIDQIAKLIHHSLTGSTNMAPIFSTTMYGLEKDSAQLLSIFNYCKQHMHSMLAVTEKKAEAVGGNLATWLMHSAICGEEDVAKALLVNRDIVNKSDASGHTALQIAIQLNHKNIVEILLDHGANVNTKVGRGTMSVLDLAILLGRPAIANLLLDKGAEVSDETISCYSKAINQYPDSASQYVYLDGLVTAKKSEQTHLADVQIVASAEQEMNNLKRNLPGKLCEDIEQQIKILEKEPVGFFSSNKERKKVKIEVLAKLIDIAKSEPGKFKSEWEKYKTENQEKYQLAIAGKMSVRTRQILSQLETEIEQSKQDDTDKKL